MMIWKTKKNNKHKINKILIFKKKGKINNERNITKITTNG